MENDLIENNFLAKIKNKIVWKAQFLKKYSNIFIVTFLLILIPFLVYGVLNQTIILRKRATSQSVNPGFYFNPAAVTVNPNQEFKVNIEIDTAGLTTSVASFQISYNPLAFEVVKILPGNNFRQTPPMFPNILRNNIDPQAGKIYLDAGVALVSPIFYSGRGIFANVTFKAKSTAAGQQNISFFLSNPANPKTPGDCDIIGTGASLGQDLLTSVNSLTVTINSPPPTPTSALTECQTKYKGVCCPGDFGSCRTRISGCSSGEKCFGCNPNKIAGGQWCCKSCAVASSPTPTPKSTVPTATPTQKPVTTATPKPPTPSPTPTAGTTLTQCESQGKSCCIADFGSCYKRDTNCWSGGNCLGCGATGKWCCERCY